MTAYEATEQVPCQWLRMEGITRDFRFFPRFLASPRGRRLS